LRAQGASDVPQSIEARRFFEARIAQQAHVEGVPLSPDERLMLKWSESEPGSVADGDLAERLAAEISDEDCKDKIAGLLARSYAADLARDPALKATWAEAFRVMATRDYYMGVMVDRAVARQLTPWWKWCWSFPPLVRRR
jgi:hypothetical protein